MSAGPTYEQRRSRRMVGLLTLLALGACTENPLHISDDAAVEADTAAPPDVVQEAGSDAPPPEDASVPGPDSSVPPACDPHAVAPACASEACPPPAPACGPGSQEYPHVSASVGAFGEGAGKYWIYEPAEPTPKSAPVLAYLHGWGAFDPSLYDALLRHLARKGYVVIFPAYGSWFDVDTYEQNARAAIAAALVELETGEHVRGDGQFALAGHSLGSLLALRLAADPSEPALPEPRALVLHEPAGSALVSYDISPAALATIPATTRLLVIQAEASVAQNNSDAIAAYARTESIPTERKNFLLVHSDDHGTPPLASDHVGVQAGEDVFSVRPLDAIDWWGYMRPTEGALAEVFGRPDPDYSAFCREPAPACGAVRVTGKWSDGVAVTPIENAGDLGL